MSSIDKLGIQGIRSFSPDEEQVIRFKKPITLISGPNGTGKSTIIESLKYATTGILPPGLGSKGGQAFIFDTELANSSEVKGTIKLLFRNRMNKTALTTRSFKLTQKGKKKEFKEVDGVLKMKDATKGDVSNTMRGSDLDKLVPELLGVSAPILDNVIFCHQDENNWPMKESAELKKKFDDIFESTRYTKALAELRKTKKDIGDKAKEANHNAEKAAIDLNRAKGLRSELEEIQILLAEDTQNGSKIDESILKVKESIADMQDQLKRFEGTFEEIKVMTGSIEECARALQRDREEFKLEKDLEDADIEKLRTSHAEYNTQFVDANAALKELDQNRQLVERERVAVRARLETSEKELATLRARWDEGQRQLKRHESLTADMRAKYPKYVTSERLSLTEMREALNLMSRDKKSEIDTAEISRQRKYEADSKELETVRGEHTVLNHERLALEERHKQLEVELEKVVSNLDILGEDDGVLHMKLKHAKDQVKEFSTELTRLTGSNVLEEKQAGIEKAKKDIKALDDRMPALQSAMKRLQDQQASIMQVRGKRSELVSNINKIISKLLAFKSTVMGAIKDSEQENPVKKAYDESLERCEGVKLYWSKSLNDSSMVSPTKRFKAGESAASSSPVHLEEDLPPRVNAKTVTECVNVALQGMRASHLARKETSDKLRNDYIQVQEEITLIVGELNSVTANLKALSNQKSKLEESLPKVEYYEVLVRAKNAQEEGERADDVALRLLKDDVEKAREQQNYRKYMKELYRVFIKQSHKEGGCAVCGQTCDALNFRVEKPVEFPLGGKFAPLRFEAKREYKGDDAFQLKLISKMESSDATEKQLLEDLRRAEDALERFRKHASTAEKLFEVEQQIILLQERQRVQEMRKDALSHKGQSIRAQEQELELPLKNSERAEKEMAEIYRICKDAERIDEDADSMEKLLQTGQASSSQSMDEVRTLDQARAKLEQLAKEKDALTNKILEETNAMQGVQASRTKATTNLLDAEKLVKDLEKQAVRRTELLKERARMNDELTKLVHDVQDILNRAKPLQMRRDDLEEARMRASETAKKEIERLQGELSAMTADVNMFDSIRQAVESATKGGVREKCIEQEEVIAKDRQALEKLDSKIREFDAMKEETEDLMRKAEAIRKSLLNAIKYAKGKQELTDKIARKAQLEAEAKVGQAGLAGLKKKLSDAEKDHNMLAMNRGEVQGSRKTREANLNRVKVQLMDASLKDIDRRHADLLIESVTTSMAQKDLERYIKALDTALMKYHSEMVDEINRRIRELWQVTYRGGDIDRVELKAEQGSGQSAHTYTYRVVMWKNHTEMDMRGRCSAGQKVLASLVIRLALADTFSTKCGVLALDEPSTNLDLENKKGLAEALADIIKARANQANFQLIVITHDDEFVEIIQNQLGTSGGPFYRVYREQDQNGRYVSRIKEESTSGVI